MTSIEIIPLVPDAAERLQEAVRRYERGSITIQEAYAVAVSAYGVEGALTMFTLEMGEVSSWQSADADVPLARRNYDGPLMPGYDLALEHALQVKLGLPAESLTG